MATKSATTVRPDCSRVATRAERGSCTATRPGPAPGTSRARPATSIVIPIHDAAATLPRCLASLAAQMRDDVQLVLVDDGSTDGTPALIDDFVARHAGWNITVVTHRANRGAGWARRSGFEASTGTYLFWLDADDHLIHGALDRIRRAERDHGERGTILVFDHVVERPDGTTVEEPGMHAGEVQGPVASADALLRSGISWYLWNKVVPRAGVTASMFSTARRGEDLLTLLELSRVHTRFLRVPEQLVAYRQSACTLSQSLDGFEHYLDLEHGVLAEVRATLTRHGVAAPCHHSVEHWFALRMLANSGVLVARRTADDHEFRRLARTLLGCTSARAVVAGARGGDRQAAAGIALLALSPRAFRRVAAGRRARAWETAPDLHVPRVSLGC